MVDKWAKQTPVGRMVKQTPVAQIRSAHVAGQLNRARATQKPVGPQGRAAKSSVVNVAGLTLSAMLSEEDRAILDFERAAWREPGPKDQAIEMSLGLSAAEYYERLRSVVSGSAALAYDPLTTKRVLTIIEDPIEAGLAS